MGESYWAAVENAKQNGWYDEAGYAGMLSALWAHRAAHGGLRKAARAIGVSSQYYSAVMMGRKRPGGALLSALGWDAHKRIVYAYTNSGQKPL